MASAAYAGFHAPPPGSLPADLEALLRLWRRQHPPLLQLLAELGCTVIDRDYQPALLDPEGYLSRADLADPMVRARCAAIEGVSAYISFVVENDEGEVIGYWHGPEQRSLHEAPIVKLDARGRFQLLPGRHLIEALLGEFGRADPAAPGELARLFAGLGIAAPARGRGEPARADATTHPASLQQRLYEAALAPRRH